MLLSLGVHGSGGWEDAMRLMLVANAILALSGCASVDEPADFDGLDMAAQRGRSFAERRCAGCHTIGLDNSPGASGPRFQDLQRRFNPHSLRLRFGEISEHGSGRMPPIEIERPDADDLVAYFDSLRGF